jgi:hypothetical protein
MKQKIIDDGNDQHRQEDQEADHPPDEWLLWPCVLIRPG